MMKNNLCLIITPSFLLAVLSPEKLYAENLLKCDFSRKISIELNQESLPREASIREHSIVWHPILKKYYLLADVIPLTNRHHPNTYESEIHLWSSPDLFRWTYHGVAVTKGEKNSFDHHGVASPAGSAFLDGKIYVPYSARKTATFQQRSIGLAWSSDNPEIIPWTKSKKPVSDLKGEDDDPALLTINQKELHLYHRIAGPNGYQIVHSSSMHPQKPDTWSVAILATPRPDTVRAQELTGVVLVDKTIHLFVIEHLYKKGVKIAHLISLCAEGPFLPIENQGRYLPHTSQPNNVIYSGHITPVSQNGKLKAFFWTVKQPGKRYGLQGHPVLVTKN